MRYSKIADDTEPHHLPFGNEHDSFKIIRQVLPASAFVESWINTVAHNCRDRLESGC